MAQVINGLTCEPYPRGLGEIGVGSTSGVCEYEDIFLDELLGLPPHRDVDFTIEYAPQYIPHFYDSL